MSEPTILCPQCRTEIKLTESLAAPLIEGAQLELEQRFAAQQNAFIESFNMFLDSNRLFER